MSKSAQRHDGRPSGKKRETDRRERQDLEEVLNNITANGINNPLEILETCNYALNRSDNKRYDSAPVIAICIRVVAAGNFGIFLKWLSKRPTDASALILLNILKECSESILIGPTWDFLSSSTREKGNLLYENILLCTKKLLEFGECIERKKALPFIFSSRIISKNFDQIIQIFDANIVDCLLEIIDSEVEKVEKTKSISKVTLSGIQKLFELSFAFEKHSEKIVERVAKFESLGDFLTISSAIPYLQFVSKVIVAKGLKQNPYVETIIKRKDIFLTPKSLTNIIELFSQMDHKEWTMIPETTSFFFIDVLGLAKHFHGIKIFGDLVQIVKFLLDPVSLNVFERNYKMVTELLIENFELFRNDSNSTYDDLRETEMQTAVLLSALDILTEKKNSLIVISGAKPPFFEFLSERLPLTESWLPQKYPEVFHLLISVLLNNLETNKFHVESSTWLQPVQKVKIYAFPSPRATYTKKQVDLLSKIVGFQGCWRKTGELIASWIKGIIENIPTGILQKVWEEECWVQLRMSFPGAMNSFGSEMFQEVTDLLHQHNLNMTGDGIQHNQNKRLFSGSSEVWKGCDHRELLRNCLTDRISTSNKQKMIPLTTFGRDEFVTVMDYLMKGTLPARSRHGTEEDKENENSDGDQVENVLNLTMFMRCLEAGNLSTLSGKEDFMEKWRWVLGQAASFCVVNKMKTPFGDTSETFVTFSKELNRLAKEALNNSSSPRTVKEEDRLQKNPPAKNGPQPTEWFRVRLLLEFIEQLEKLMRSIITNGSTFTLSNPSNQSKQFFVKNAESCMAWLLKRTYTVAMIVAFFNGYYAQTIRFGTCVLKEMEERKDPLKPEDLTRARSVSTWMGRAMASTGSEQSIVGLATWLTELLKLTKPPRIFSAFCHVAAGRFEQAAHELKEIITNDPTSSEVEKIVARYTRVDVHYRLRSSLGIPQALAEPQGQPFDDDFSSVLALINFQRAAEPVSATPKGWMLNEQLLETELTFTHTLKRTDVLTIKKDLSRLAAYTFCAENGPNRLCARVTATQLVATALYEQMKHFKETAGAPDMRGKLSALLSPNMNASTFGQGTKNVADRLTTMLHLRAYEQKFTHHTSMNTCASALKLARESKNLSLCMELNPPAGWLENSLEAIISARQTNKPATVLKIARQKLKMSEDFERDEYQSRLELIKVTQLAEGYCLENEDVAEEVSKSYMLLSEKADYTSPADIPIQLTIMNYVQRTVTGRPREALLLKAIDVCPNVAKAKIEHAKYLLSFATTGIIEIFETAGLELETRKLVIQNDYLKNVKTPEELNKMFARVSSSERMKVAGAWLAATPHRQQCELVALARLFEYVNDIQCAQSSNKWTTLETALLIVDLICQHGNEAVKVVSPMIEQAHASVWKELIPQLIARLAHPAPLVRKVMVQLLQRIATVSPNSLVFQVIGAAQVTSGDVAENNDRDVMREGYRQLEEHLAVHFPKLVADVRLFIKELEKINILNEEKWSLVLGWVEREARHRIEQKKHELTSTSQYNHLTEEDRVRIAEKKFEIFLDEVFGLLEPLYERTCVRSPESENEIRFQEAYGSRLKELIESRHDQKLLWPLVRQMITLLAQKLAKKGSQVFSMESLSTVLASMHSTTIPMPGCEDDDPTAQPVTIHEVGKTVWVLASKTRPKKLSFVGSDGIERPFVFKGREDLHLDERIMQFYKICNSVLSEGSTKRSNPSYEAFTYSVVPLGPCSGLIQWVQRAAPLMSIYKKYIIRERERSGKKDEPLERFSDMYQRILNETLKDMNIDRTKDRKHYPDEAMKKALKILTGMTPNDLLSRELWLRNVNSTSWWAATSRFARSTAVMSILGYVLGLGDRHLENLMVNLITGTVVHIDYNVCFDKGKKLRVPETVPFRLTRNIVHALGPTGVKGTFEESCTEVLQRLSQADQSLRAVLNVFIYHPLADWTSHNESSHSSIHLAMNIAVFGSEWKRENLLQTATATFEVRLEELMVPIRLTCAELRVTLSALSGALERTAGQQELFDWQLRLDELCDKLQSFMKVILPLIRTLALTDERFSNFFHMYNKEVIEPLNRGRGELREVYPSIQTAVRCFDQVADNVGKLLDQLPKLNKAEKKHYVPPPPGLEDVWLERRDQEGNLYAKAVIDTVMRRLDQKQLSGAQASVKVAELISEATDEGRLSRMYEGWTSWV